MKVLFVDALTAPNAIANVAGMTKAYRRVVQEVRTFNYRSLAGRQGKEQMNKVLFQCASEFEPDFIHLGKCESVRGRTISRIKERLPTVKVIHFYGDYRPWTVPWVVEIGRACDRTVMQIDGGPLVEAYEKAGVHDVGYWIAGTDPEIYWPHEVESRDLGIVFMGTLGSPQISPWHKGRRDLMLALVKHNNVNVFGKGWNSIKHPRFFLHRYVGSDGFSQACSRAEIALGYGAFDVPGYTSWPRVLNSMICGCFFLTRYFTGLEKIFERGIHLDWFRSIPEAVEKVAYYQSHPGHRDMIGQQGREEVLRNHTWDHRIKLMLEYAGFEVGSGG